MNSKLEAVFDKLRRADLVQFSDIDLDSPNIRSPLSGETPLHIAVIWDDLDSVQTLLEAGADPNIPGEDDYTSLHHAADGNIEIVRSLLLHGADPLLIDRYGHTPRDYAQMYDRSDILSLFDSHKAEQDAAANP